MRNTFPLYIILAFRMITIPIEAFSSCRFSAFSVARKPHRFHLQPCILQAKENEGENEFIALGDEELDEATLAEIEAGEPSKWMVIQRVRTEIKLFVVDSK